MKKLLAALAITATLLSSCAKEQPEQQKDNRLVGTKWESENWEAAIFGAKYDVIEFIDNERLVRSMQKDGHIVHLDGTYQYTFNENDNTMYTDADTTCVFYVYEYEMKSAYKRTGVTNHRYYKVTK